MTQPIAKFHEEVSAKIPALTLLTNLGYQFLSPAQALAMRESLSSVVLVDILRQVLKQKKFEFQGKTYPLSDAAIDNIIHQLSNPAMNEGLRMANEKLYNALTYGVSVTEFIGGKKVSPTIQVIDWENPANNQYHVTEEFEVINTHGIGKRIPDIVCFVNALPWVAIEAKRPDSSHTGKPTVEGKRPTVPYLI
jgi:type I restriction enzyme R subunit